MNLLKMITLLLMVSSGAQAASIKLNCGRTMHVMRTIVISEKSTAVDGYTHSALFKTSGSDNVTGMVKAVTYRMVGQSDLSTEFTGKEESVLAFVGSKNPLFQLLVSKPTSNKMAPIPAMEINLQTKSINKFNCFLN